MEANGHSMWLIKWIMIDFVGGGSSEPFVPWLVVCQMISSKLNKNMSYKRASCWHAVDVVDTRSVRFLRNDSEIKFGLRDF